MIVSCKPLKHFKKRVCEIIMDFFEYDEENIEQGDLYTDAHVQDESLWIRLENLYYKCKGKIYQVYISISISIYHDSMETRWKSRSCD